MAQQPCYVGCAGCAQNNVLNNNNNKSNGMIYLICVVRHATPFNKIVMTNKVQCVSVLCENALIHLMFRAYDMFLETYDNYETSHLMRHANFSYARCSMLNAQCSKALLMHKV